VNQILIADDDPAIQRLLERVLRREGFQVATASNGREALERIQRETPDLLLLDLMMPVVDGWEVYRRLRVDDHLDIPIIVLTAGERVDRARKELADACVLAKPFDLDELLARINEKLSAGTAC
jgi:DNA-binding response OmpR family regulator